jgi:pyocin large subunit-like protein
LLVTGKGLGRNESGITEALKPKLKFDTRGVGHDASEQFTYHWWEHAFDKAANNIQVSATEVSEELESSQGAIITHSDERAVIKLYQRKLIFFWYYK